MALDRLTKIDGGGISTTSDYRVGVITATKFVGPIEGTITSTDATFTGNVSIAGTLTYEDVTNVDSVGVITARNGIKVSTGTATTALVVDGDARVTGILTVGTSSLKLDGPNNVVNVGTALTLGHSQGVQFHTQNLHAQGFEINQINASGIITASQFKGDGSQLTGIDATALKDPAGNVKIQAQASGAVHTGIATFQDLDVDGHTNLDNVSVAGVTTFSDHILVKDDKEIRLGDTNDFRLFHDNTNTLNIINAQSGNFRLQQAGTTFLQGVGTGVKLYFGGNAKFETIGYGVSVTGTITGNNLTLLDNDPELTFTDLNNNPDYRIKAESGNLSFEDTTNGNVARLRINADGHVDVTGNLDVGAGLDVDGNITSVDTTSGSTVTRTLKVGASAASGTNSGTIIINNGGLGNASLQFDYEGSAARAKIYTYRSTNHIIFDTSGTERFRLRDNNANGIALITSPASGDTLNLQTDAGGGQGMILGTDVSGNTNIYIKNNSSGHFGFQYRHGSTTQLEIASSGKILTYTTGSESSQFSTTNSGGAYQQYDLGASGAQLGYIGAGSLLVSASGVNDFGIRSQANMVFSTGGAVERLRIKSDGKVGINDNNPAALLTVNNGTSDAQFVQMKNDEVGLFLGSYGTGSSYPREVTINGTRTDSGSSPYLRIAGQGGIKFCADLNNERLRITSDGRVTLGQVDPSSSSALHIRSNTSAETTLELSTKDNYNGSLPSAKISFTQQNGTEIARIKCDTNTGAANMADLVFWTNYGGLSERMRITKTGGILIPDSGKVSVGPTNPVARFQVGPANGSRQIEIEEYGVIRGYDRNSNAWAQIDFEGSSYSFDTSGTERMYLHNRGVLKVYQGVDTQGNAGGTFYSPYQTGYVGTQWTEQGAAFVFYMGELASGSSSNASTKYVTVYTSHHWGDYPRLIIWAHERYYRSSFTCWTFGAFGGSSPSYDLTQTESWGGSNGGHGTNNAGSISVNHRGPVATYSGSQVHAYELTMQNSGTYGYTRWYVGVVKEEGEYILQLLQYLMLMHQLVIVDAYIFIQ